MIHIDWNEVAAVFIAVVLSGLALYYIFKVP